MNILTMKNITKAYRTRPLFDKQDFSVDSGDKIGVVGLNGTGKSTLLKIIAGIEKPDEGEITKGNAVKIGYLPQMPEFPEQMSVYDYVVSGCRDREWEVEADAKEMLQKLEFSDISQKLGILSGGQKKKAALAAAFLMEYDLLILDEPTNHLNYDTVLWLEQYLKNRKAAFIMVTHDRYFLDRVCNRIVEIDQGAIYSYQTNFEGFLQAKAEREEMQLASYRKNQSILKKELAWMQRGAKARSTKQKARIERFEQLKQTEALKETEQLDMNSVSSRMGKKTIELNHLSKSYGEHVLFEDFSYIFLKNDRVGFIGPNGCGKTTLMKIIAGVEQPDEGFAEQGSTIKTGYFSQENEALDEKMRVIDYVKETAEFIRTKDGLVSASKMLERFLFDSEKQYALIEKLSGGEKRRLYLLKVLMEAPNVLILDEPTNDIDIQTLAVLEDYLLNFDGIVIAVSHDRYFLDKVVNRIFACENGRIVQYEGGFSDYYEKCPKNEPVVQTKIKNTNPKSWKEKSSKLKFTYKEQREYETIEQDIEKLEQDILELDRQMENSATDFVKLRELTEKKEQLEQFLEEKMERYVYLEELAEKIAGQ